MRAAGATGRVAVVGGGITGLAAAFDMHRAGLEPVVLEAGGRAGGKIDSHVLEGLRVDTGPDGFLAWPDDAVRLSHDLGLGDELVAPAASGAFVLCDGLLRPLPHATVLGAPFDPEALGAASIVSPRGERALREGLSRDSEPLRGDATVGAALRPRVGDEVFERLVDPLLGGINAGSADEMSIEACAAPLYEAARRGGPFGEALRAVARERAEARRGAHTPGPVFQTLRGGAFRLADALVAELAGAVNLNTPAEGLRRGAIGRRGHGWTVRTRRGDLAADGVILTTPAAVTAALLEPHSAEAAETLGAIEYSDVLLATYAVPADMLARPLDGSGYLVPRHEGLLMTACSWASSKWAHYDRTSVALLRVSAGRSDDRRWLEMGDRELAATLASELALCGVTLDSSPHVHLETSPSRPARRRSLAARLAPWPRSLPQYRPGHLARISDVETHLWAETPGVLAAGAALRGLGLPACVRQGRAAAADAARLCKA